MAAAALVGAMLAGAGALLAGPSGSDSPPTVKITARYSRFTPDRVNVKPGATVRFVIHNADPIDHEFIIGPPETHEIHERGAPHFHTGASRGEVTVPAGATVETTWTFGPRSAANPGGSGVSPGEPGGSGVSPGEPGGSGVSPGEIEYGCHLAGHWTYGMRGKALVR